MTDDLERPFREAYGEMQAAGMLGGMHRPPANKVATVCPSVLDELVAAVTPPPYPINYGYSPAPAAEKPTEVECPICRQMVPANKKPCTTAVVFCNQLRRPKW